MDASTAAQLQIGNQYLQIGRLDDAEKVFRGVLRIDPDNAKAHESLGFLYLQGKEHALARQHLARACDLQSNNPHAHKRLANLHEILGDFDEAKACYRKAMDLNPKRAAEYYSYIAQITRFSAYDDEVQTIERLYEDADHDSDDRLLLAFSLGKAFDELGEYRKAFGFYAEGNRVARKKHTYSPAAEDASYRRIAETFDQNFFRRFSDSGLDDPKPIFVTGLPRSGSTLVEQILASHSEVFGGLELDSFPKIAQETVRGLELPAPEVYRDIDPGILKKIGRRYLDDLAAVADGESRVTDKSMDSAIFLGLISVILPAAKIIHCRRDLRDLGLSCFQQYFGDNQQFSYDLRSIAHYSLVREKLLDHWQKVLPDRIFSIPYEDLVNDPESWTRKLLDHCGLSFEAHCLSPHETPREVNTMSLEQVRQPVYRSSVGRWKNYARELQPLIDGLGAATA